MELTFGEQIKIILKRKNMTIRQLAELIEMQTGRTMSRQNLTQKLNRDNFQEQDMKEIAQALGCVVQISVIDPMEATVASLQALMPPKPSKAPDETVVLSREALEREEQENKAPSAPAAGRAREESAESDVLKEIEMALMESIQKEMIHMCRSRKKPVIIATQMLHSMIENPRPTRAEVTDVANAIFQSTDAIMLSGETASGKYPVEAVATMTKIAKEAEKSIDISLDLNLEMVSKPIAAVLAKELVAATQDLPVKAIIFDTWTGRTGRYLSEFRPKVPIYAMCYNDFTMRELALTYDIYCYKFPIQKSKEEFVRNAVRMLMEEGRIASGDLVGFIGGSFNDELGATYLEFKYVQ